MSKYSEALECLENIEADLTGLPKHVTEYDDGFDNYLEDIWYNIDAIKQALLKAQEQEKENAYIEKIKTMLKQKDCALRYIESEDCFAVKTICDGWYKLTPKFVENNVREEIKPLPIIEKSKQLKKENQILKDGVKALSHYANYDASGRLLRILFNDYNSFNEKDIDVVQKALEVLDND